MNPAADAIREMMREPANAEAVVVMATLNPLQGETLVKIARRDPLQPDDHQNVPRLIRLGLAFREGDDALRVPLNILKLLVLAVLARNAREGLQR